jgi:2,3-diketo-5-methylthio-1-phosphopentane phosphatase/HAD superfamily hydrolase (TIGR01549 family)
MSLGLASPPREKDLCPILPSISSDPEDEKQPPKWTKGRGKDAMKHLILCDFDGTISMRDMGYELLSAFARGNWEEIDRQYREGKIGSREAYTRIAGICEATPEEMESFIGERSLIDPYFGRFHDYCLRKAIDLNIVSDGFDVYINRILEHYDLPHIPIFANRISFKRDGRIRFDHPHHNRDCGLCGTCKRAILLEKRPLYDRITYIGNGYSDRCAAQEADWIYAKEVLFEHCVREGIDCTYFDHFGEVVDDLSRRTKGLIFDLDGTLIDSYEAIYIGLVEVFNHFAIPPFPFHQLGEYLGGSLEEILKSFLPPHQIKEAKRVFREKYRDIYLDKTPLIEGAEDVIEELFRRSIRLAVASNKSGKFSRKLLAQFGIDRFFTTIMGVGDGLRPKPFPDMVNAVVKDLALHPNEIIMVGDTAEDIKAGKAAGIDVYALGSGYHPLEKLIRERPRRVLRELSDLLQALRVR